MNRYLMLRPPDSPAAYNPASSSGMNRQQVRIHKRIANNALTQLFEGGFRTHIDAPMGLEEMKRGDLPLSKREVGRRIIEVA